MTALLMSMGARKKKATSRGLRRVLVSSATLSPTSAVNISASSMLEAAAITTATAATPSATPTTCNHPSRHDLRVLVTGPRGRSIGLVRACMVEHYACDAWRRQLHGCHSAVDRVRRSAQG